MSVCLLTNYIISVYYIKRLFVNRGHLVQRMGITEVHLKHKTGEIKMAFVQRDVTVGAGKSEKKVVLLDNPEFKGKNPLSLVHSVTWSGGGWVWLKDSYPANTRGKFFEDQTGKAYILIITGNEIVDIYEIAKLDKYVLINRTKTGPVYDGRERTPKEQLKLKQSIANAVGMRFILTHAEEFVQKVEREKAQAEKLKEYQEKQARIQAERDAKNAENARIKTVIKSRNRLKGYAGTAAKYFNGVPVVGDEWMKLEPGEYCVQVESYNDEDKTHGTIVSCFTIKREGSLKLKKDEDTFSFSQTGTAKVVSKAIGELNYIDTENDPCQAYVYTGKDAVLALQKAGLNSGRLVAIPTTEKDVFQLVKVTAKVLTDTNKVKGVYIPY